MMNKLYSRIAAPLAALVMAAFVAACGGGGGGSTPPPPGGGTPTAPSGGGTTTPPSGGDAATNGMRELTSLQLSKLMSPGWNVGNSLDAGPNETGWGNPLINQTLMNAVKAAGFKTVRIPVTWTLHVDADDNIDPVWMARVAEVVKYARNAGLYAIINLHHEGHWLNHTTYDRQAANNARLGKLWTQIANHFKDHDDYLLFAGLNEVGRENAPWGVLEQEWADVQNSYHQTFVDAVRATGGNNAKRHLIVQGYFTNIDQTLSKTVMPTDTAANRLFMEVHYYDPWNFALNKDSPIWQWGAIATDPNATETWANEAYADAQFQKLKTRYVDAGVPVLMGEYGAILKSEHDPTGKYRTYWTQYVTKSMVQHGIVPVWWDNGYDSNHQFGLFNRTTGAQYFPDLVKAIVESAQ